MRIFQVLAGVVGESTRIARFMRLIRLFTKTSGILEVETSDGARCDDFDVTSWLLEKT